MQGICCFQELFGSCIFPPEGYLFRHCFHQTSPGACVGLADGIIGCSIDLIPEGFPTFYNVVRYLNLLCSFFQGLFQLCTNCLLIQAYNVEAFGCWLPLGASLGKYPDIYFLNDESMVCPTFCTTHGLGYSDVLSISLPDDDIVDKMPVLRAGVHP